MIALFVPYQNSQQCAIIVNSRALAVPFWYASKFSQLMGMGESLFNPFGILVYWSV